MSRENASAALARVDPDLGIFIELDADRVLKAAEAPRAGRLSGMLIAVKDLFDTADLRTTYGSALFGEHVPARSAALVDLVESQGGLVMGKTNLNEFAYGVSGYNPHYGPIRAPHDRSRTAGGSSGGSAAAVAAGVCRLGLGTDTSGSIRIPAGCCNVYGFKAAYGAFSTTGVFPLAESYDSVGFFAADVADLQLVLGLDSLPDPSELRIAQVGIDVELPRLPEEHWIVFRHEVWGVHGERFDQEADRYGKDLRFKLRLPIGDVEAARTVLDRWRGRFVRAMEGIDVVLGPLVDGIAPTVEAALAEYEADEFIVGERLLRHTPAYNELGWPALAVPTADGPIQLAARPGDEAALLAVAREIGLGRADTVVG